MTTTLLELDPVKDAQRRMWASGDYAAVAARLQITSENLLDAADLRPGSRVLDVAAGSGNATLAAMRCGCEALGVDYVPSLLGRARGRIAAEGFDAEFVEGDAEALPFPDASFDGVVSAFGVMFAPDHERAAAELLRVCRPGGTVALACWTPDGFVGEMFGTVAAHAPVPPPGPPPTLWGTEEHVAALLGDGVDSLRTTRRVFTLRYRSPEEFADYFLTRFGPILTVAAALDDDGRRAFRDDLVALARRHSRRDDAMVAPGPYLETIAVRA
jgi:SAM-dependent methyltransferase